MKMKMIALMSLLLIALMVGSVLADQILFDREAFIARLIAPVIEDFEDEVDGPIIGDPWLGLGIVFDELGVGDNMQIGTTSGGNTHISAMGGEQADIEVSFPDNPPFAFGLAVLSNEVHDPSERIIFYGLGGSVLVDIEMPQTGGQTDAFVGYFADEPIARVEFIEAADADFVGIGDFAFAGSYVAVDRETWSSVKALYR